MFLAGTCFALSTSESSWWASWRQAVDNTVGTVVLVGPLLAGLVAATYGSSQRSSLADLVTTSVHPLRGWFGPAVGLWAVAAVTQVVVLGVITVRSHILDVPTPPRQFIIVPIGLLTLAVHALIGMAIGLRVPPRSAALVAAVISFGLFILSTDHLAPPSFNTGGVTGSMYGEQYRVAAVFALCAFAVLSALVLAPWVGPGGQRPRVRWTVTSVAAIGIVALAQFTWPDLEKRLEPSGPLAYRCGGTGPEVCVVTERPGDDLAAAARRMRELADPLVRTGATLPPRWRQSLFGLPADPGSGDLIIGDGTITDPDLIRSLIEPADCPQFPDGNEPPSVFDVRVRILYWVRYFNRIGNAPDRPWFHSAAGRDWVRTTYDQLRKCQLDDLRLP